MHLIRGLHNLRHHHQGSVVTVGNFDGVHLGHQAILDQVVNKAKELNQKATVILFEPQPREFFQQDHHQLRVMPLRDKLQALSCRAVDQILCLRFNQSFASMSAQAFIDRILVEGLGTRHLIVGDDFHFGCDRRGNFSLLQQQGPKNNFTVEDTPSVLSQGDRVSSTRIRAALVNHQFELAETLLGHRFRLSGRVRHGDQIGRTLNCPTANLALLPQQLPLAGIYAVRVSADGLQQWPGVASCGTRPTVNGTDNRLEVHLLDYQGDLYGKYLSVEFLHFFRHEEKFTSLADMQLAIDNDIQQTHQFFQQQDTP